MKEPMIPWITAEITQATVEIRSGKIRYRWMAAMAVVMVQETGPPRKPDERIPITRAFGSAPVTCIPMLSEIMQKPPKIIPRMIFSFIRQIRFPFSSSPSFKRRRWIKSSRVRRNARTTRRQILKQIL